MSSYLTPAQHAKLLEGINPGRVGTDGKGFSHVEAYEIRAHLIRIFGPARWSQDLIDLTQVFETENQQGKWSVCYRATVRLTVCAEDGTVLATYTEAATGEAKNQPHRGDAHDLAMKTAESQAMKRCAANLGDQFGLSLYRKGSKAPLVVHCLVRPEGSASVPAPKLDAHITESVPESEQVEDKREVNEPTPIPQTPPAEASGNSEVDKRREEAERIRLAALNPPADAGPPYFARLQMEATKAKVMKMPLVPDGDGNMMALGALIQRAQRTAA